MTAIIGFLTKDGIVLAADSQASDEVTGTKSLDSRKLFQVRFRSGDSALIARAGSIEGADIFHDEFEQLAAETDVVAERTIANTAEAALKNARARILRNAKHLAASKRQVTEELAGRNNAFILAYVFAGKPLLFQGDLVAANPVKVMHHFVALGSGRSTAGFVLSGMNTMSLEIETGLCIAAYTIAMCKKADLYCEGPMQIGSIGFSGSVKLLLPIESQSMQEAVEKTYQQMCSVLATAIRLHFMDIVLPRLDSAIDKLLEEKRLLLERRKAVALTIQKPSGGKLSE